MELPLQRFAEPIEALSVEKATIGDESYNSTISHMNSVRRPTDGTHIRVIQRILQSPGV